jgi:PKD repeat protein
VATVHIEVQAVNDAPQVSAGGPYNSVVGSSVTLSAVATDVEDASLAVTWDVDGNGSYETMGTSVAYTPTNAGTHSVPVRVTDSGGLVAATTAVVSARYNVCLAYRPDHAVRSGATVPLRVQLCDATGVNLSSPAIVLSARLVVRTSDFISGVVEDAGHANPDADFRYDAGLEGYIFNFQTSGLSTGSWSVQFVAGGEAVLYSAPFQVK